MAQYGKIEYWDERYTRDPEPFDWYQRWSGVREHIMPFLEDKSQILVVGCGNSRLSEEMYDEGFQNITNVDISNVVIKSMQEKYKDKSGMSFAQQDIRHLETQEGTYNVVVDKGTLDSILCGEQSTHNVQKALAEITRVLDPKGVYISISHGQPSYRLSYLQRPEFGWEVKVNTVLKPMMGMANASQNNAPEDKDNVHYVYVCTKGVAATTEAGS